MTRVISIGWSSLIGKCRSIFLRYSHWSLTGQFGIMESTRELDDSIAPPTSTSGKFHSENASSLLRPHYVGGISKRDDHWSFCICVWGNLGQRNHVIIVTQSFSKGFHRHENYREAGVFKFPKERFRKASFSWRIGVDGRPNSGNKAVFSNSSGLVWTRPIMYYVYRTENLPGERWWRDWWDWGEVSTQPVQKSITLFV